MATYEVMVDRTVTQWASVTVEADSREDAEMLALEDAANLLSCEWDSIDETAQDYEVREVELVDGEDGGDGDPEDEDDDLEDETNA